MEDVVTVTSKGQITIPKKIQEALKLKKGDKLVVRFENGELIFTPQIKNPLIKLNELRKDITFTRKEIEEMIRDSKEAWNNL